MKLKNILMVIGGFLVGVVITGIVAVKFVKALLMRISEHEIFLQMVKDSWIDVFIKILYGNTDGYIERKLREEGYVRYKYRPRDEENEAWKRWKDNLERKMKERDDDQ